MKTINKINKMKTLVASLLVVTTVCLGMFSSAFAGNTQDTNYQFHNTNTRGTTDGRPKNDTTKVYVHPTSGPALTYSVRGANNADGDGVIVVSGSFTIYNGTQASITNRVYEEGKPYAQLHFERTVYADAWTYGVWSPDSTRNYTVYG